MLALGPCIVALHQQQATHSLLRDQLKGLNGYLSGVLVRYLVLKD